ncbi:MAG TPA: Bor family protein [Gemmatimonadaceae bacterium]
MRVLRKQMSLIAVAVLLAGCYHAIVDTGRPPSSQVIDRPWSNSFIYGLVPPPVLETMAKCPNGVSKVETQHSFLNELVAVITAGIYTPMSIRVTCAGSGTSMNSNGQMLDVGANATPAARRAVVEHAATMAVTTGQPVYVRF